MTTSTIAEPNGTPSVAAEPSAPRRWWVRAGRPPWALPAQASIALLSVVVYTWDLSRSGLGSSFYAAAVKSGSLSWKAFFFGSLDPGSFTTVDKPPASLWVQGLSARVFGFSSWSLLLPEALAGVASVLIVYRLVRRWAGEPAAVLAALGFALTPVAVVMFRFNNPDAILTFLLIASAWALWSALERDSTWRLAACGGLLGLAFTTKTLEAFIVLPAFGLVYLVAGRPGLRRRITQLLVAGITLIVASSWWVAIVELWPHASRPYIGGSTNNSELNLIFGYNGFSRIFGSSGAGGGPVSGGIFGGAPSWLRMFNDQLGGQISWLLPLATVGLVTGLALTGRAPRTDRLRAGYLLWGGWMFLDVAVFSEAKGIFHPYYAVALAPAVAAVAAAGSVALWRLGRRNRWLAALLPAAVAVTAVWAAVLLGRTPSYNPGLAVAILVAGALAAVGLWGSLAGLVRGAWLAVSASVVAVSASLAGPSAYALTTVNHAISAGVPTAGPASRSLGRGSPLAGLGSPAGINLPKNFEFPDLGTRGGPGAFGGNTSVSKALVAYLESHRDSSKYLLAVTGSQTAAPFIISTGQPVMAMGGFSTSDPNPTLAQFKQLVATGQVHYVLIGGGLGASGPFAGGLPLGAGERRGDRPSNAPGGGLPFIPGGIGAPGALTGSTTSRSSRGGFSGLGGSGTAQAINQWVAKHGTLVATNAYGGGNRGEQLYYVGSAAVLR